MALSVAYIIAAISIILLVIYGTDVFIFGGTEAGKGFLPFDAMTRGIGFGGPPIILSIAAFFISRKEPSKGLGAMILAAGILIIIGGVAPLAMMSPDEENSARMAGEGGGLIAIGAFITALGAIKLKKS